MCWRFRPAPGLDPGDTTEIKFPTNAQRRRGLGPVKQGNTYGVVVHAMIAVDATTNACLGLVGGDVWTRPGLITTHHRDRPLSERESRRWPETAEQAKVVLASAAMVTVVDDREGDIYPKWASVPQDNFHLLTRAMVDRRLANPEAGGATLFGAAAAFPVAGTRKIDPRLRKGRPASASAGSRQAHSHGGNTVWRSGSLSPARRAGPHAGKNRAASSG